MSKAHNYPEKLLLEITVEDAANGKAQCCTECPTALALFRAFLEADVIVGESVILWEGKQPKGRRNDYRIEYRISTKLANAIKSFDAGQQPFSPGTYELTKDSESDNLGFHYYD